MLGIRPYLITSNGARVHGPDDTRIHAQDVPADAVRQLVRPELVGTHGRVIVNLFTNDGWLIDRDAPQLLAFHQDSGFRYEIVDMLAHDGADIAKVLYIGEPRIWPSSRAISRAGSATRCTSRIRCPIALR